MKHSTKFMPTLDDFEFSKEEIEKPKDNRACLDFIGGEDAGIERVNDYLWGTKSVGKYVTTRNDLLGSNYSSKISPWLAIGALSPRYVYF
jgi:deoxyribodipyrimidine photo-lyase